LEPIFYIDGDFVAAGQAKIPVDDLAILRGYGVFDLLRTHGGKPYKLKDHVDRLIDSAQAIGLTLPWGGKAIMDVVRRTLAKNRFAEANIRIVVTGGSSPDFITPQGKPRLLVLITPVAPPPAWWYRDGIKIITISAERSIPDAKSIDYIPATIALRQAKKLNAVEAIYVDRDDHVLEGTTSNLFMVKDGDLITPGRGILSGITRKTVIEISRAILPVEIRDIPRAEMLEADELFITGSSKGVVPVVQVDDRIIANGRCGPITRQIMEALQRHHAETAI
jgi:branched-chain amino acid aminotransferase